MPSFKYAKYSPLPGGALPFGGAVPKGAAPGGAWVMVSWTGGLPGGIGPPPTAETM